jgi:hypothetical protein
LTDEVTCNSIAGRRIFLEGYGKGVLKKSKRRPRIATRVRMDCVNGFGREWSDVVTTEGFDTLANQLFGLLSGQDLGTVRAWLLKSHMKGDAISKGSKKTAERLSKPRDTRYEDNHGGQVAQHVQPAHRFLLLGSDWIRLLGSRCKGITFIQKQNNAFLASPGELAHHISQAVNESGG